MSSSSPVPTPPPVSRSFSSQQSPTTSANTLSVNATRHQHSHSHSGAPSTTITNPPTPIGRQSPASATLQQPAAAGGNRFRASVDAQKLASGPNGTYSAPRGPRPSSEMLPGATLGDPETDAIDRWFEDLQHYEQTLEEMAAASLDQNFKEELGAIEQWFRVLSEAERTAALYSLLQSSTQVQIRFFITVLQQMARCDPSNAALFSPSNPQQASMEAQMEAKLASMGLKSPASPVVRQFARQSLGAGAAYDNYLSPHSAMNTEEHGSSLLASQRAKLKAQSHRISAPGTLSSSSGNNNFSTSNANLWGGLTSEAIAEQSVRSSSPRPKSTGSDYGMTAGNSANNLMRSPAMGGVTSFEELSPMVGGGSWASMVNTPVVPMFSQSENNGEAPLSPRFDMGGVNNALSGWSNVGSSQSNINNNSNMVLDDAKKFRRPGRPNGNGSPAGQPDGQRRAVSASQPTSQQRNNLPSSPNLGGNNMLSPQQAAALSAQQNWRSVNGLLSSSAGPNSQATTPITGNMSPADMASALLMQQQQMQQQMQAQLQLQQNLMVMNGMNGMNLMNSSGNSGNMLSPNFNMGMGLGLPNSAGLPGMGSPSLGGGMSPGGNRPMDRRSPRLSDHRNNSMGNRTPNTANVVPGSGSNPDEVIDLSLLSDISSWMRSLRLHKYTPNFEGSKWQDMVKMDEAALEAKGVSAQGARRKLLKVFENVRVQLWNEERPPPSANDGDTSVDA